MATTRYLVCSFSIVWTRSPSALSDVLNLLGEAGEGLQFAGDGGYQLGIDALANRAVLLEGGLAVEARVPDQEYRLSAFEVDWHRTGVEDRERQLTAIARINMKP